MTTIRHPVTGALMNDIQHIATGPITETEIRTARLLQAEGHPRWVVAAMLGRFPLAFAGTGARPVEGKRPLGGHLSTGAARSDDRQPDMFDILFGDDGDQCVTPAPS